MMIVWLSPKPSHSLAVTDHKKNKLGTQAKYYQLKESKVQNALSQLSIDDDFYSTIKNPEYVLNSIDIDTTWKSLPELIAKSSSNKELSQLAFFGNKIETKFGSECEVQFIARYEVEKIDNLLRTLKIDNKDDFIFAFNNSQEAPYDEIIYADMFSHLWNHFKSLREFITNCKDSNSSILVLII